MLSVDGLVQHAKERGMPAGKVRGAAREYAQVLILKSLYQGEAADHLVFLGGTALRLGFHLPRFSEDLDFDVKDLSFQMWRRRLEACAHALSQWGLQVEARTGEKGSLLSGDFRLSGFLQAYQLTSNPQEKLMIKCEANRPAYRVAADPRALSGFGEIFVVPFASPGLALAEKLLAFTHRELGRDVYDLFFMAGKAWTPDPVVLKTGGFQGRVADRVAARLQAWGPVKLKRMAHQLEPFLFEPAQVKLVVEATHLLPPALAYLKS